DPCYVTVGAAAALGAVANVTPGVRRCSVSGAFALPGALPQADINRWFSLQDEIEFDTLGQVKNTAGAGYSAGNAPVNRPGTYTPPHLVRPPQHGFHPRGAPPPAAATPGIHVGRSPRPPPEHDTRG